MGYTPGQPRMTTDSLMELATARHRAGDLAEARRLYSQVLAAAPDDLTTLFRVGLIELQENRPAAALALIERAAAAQPAEPRYQMGLGRALQALGRAADAAAAYRRVLAVNPGDPDAPFALAAALQSSGDQDGAIAAYRAALATQPDEVNALNNLGVMLCARHEFAEAEVLLRRAVALDETHAAAAFNLANALHGQGRIREAIDQYRRTLMLRPDHAQALCNLGNAYKEIGELALAHDSYAAAIGVQPDSVVALNNMGCLLRTQGDVDGAERMLRRALALEPERAALHDNLGNVLKDAGELDSAIDSFREALRLDPAAAATHSNLAYALSFQSAEPGPILQECRRWSDRFAAGLCAAAARPDVDDAPDRRLRVGYVSPDFRDHCQSLFTLPVLSRHDHRAFEIYCYSDAARPDDYTRRIAACADVWRETCRLDDEALAARIRDDRIDILVDLTMHMAGGRPRVFARKPAPIQIAWLAYPGTTGIEAMDYRLSDPRLDPPGHDGHYSERTIRLPDSFWCYDPLADGPAVNALPALERGFVTFGCLNNPCKLRDATLSLWSGVMRTLPAARLLLMAPEGRSRERLAARLAAHGIAAARVSFVNFRPRAQYLRTYHDVDIGLDTFPYNGHTTSLDALWMGVPVVSRVGATCVGRGGLSQLVQVDLAHLAAAADATFVAAAVELAQDLPRLAALRRTLRGRLESSPLMDAPRFARHLETAYRRVFRDLCNGP